MRSVLPVLLAACATGLDAPLVVRTLDPQGQPLAVTRAAFHDAETFAVPLRDVLTPLVCADDVGADEPCATWTLDALPDADRLHVVAELTQPERSYPPIGESSCFFWSTSHTWVRVPTDDTAQVVHLVLDPEAGWCDTLTTSGPVEPLPLPELHPDDVRWTPAAPTGGAALVAEDADGAPMPLATATWYHPPDSEAYDGEHPLACADALCTRWAFDPVDRPTSAPYYVAGTWVGPYHPLLGAAWHDLQGARVEDADAGPATIVLDPTITLVE